MVYVWANFATKSGVRSSHSQSSRETFNAPLCFFMILVYNAAYPSFRRGSVNSPVPNVPNFIHVDFYRYILSQRTFQIC